MSRVLGTSVSQKTQHETSERLCDLHPYFEEDNLAYFAKEVDPHQVERAFGLRAIEKLAELLKFAKLAKESVTIALRVLLAITSDQKEKQRAIAAGIVDSCTLLLEEDDENVREQSAYALASLATPSVA